MNWDILIRRGVIIDGSGSPGFVGDIALSAGRIAALGRPWLATPTRSSMPPAWQ
jgi:N-acyl-D-aspartate/D-glutamate deacylase